MKSKQTNKLAMCLISIILFSCNMEKTTNYPTGLVEPPTDTGPRRYINDGSHDDGFGPSLDVALLNSKVMEGEHEQVLSTEADINQVQFRGYILLNGSNGLNGWHVVLADMNDNILASRTSFLHWQHGSGHYDQITTATDPVCLPETPLYQLIMYDDDWNWRLWETFIYFKSGVYEIDFIWYTPYTSYSYIRSPYSFYCGSGPPNEN